MFFLNRKERAIAKHNKKIQDAQRAYDGHGKCYTCKYGRCREEYFYDVYDCKLHYTKPRENEKCEHHIYDKWEQKKIDYVEKNVYKDLFRGREEND